LNLISSAELEQVEACLATLLPWSHPAPAASCGGGLAALHRAIGNFVLAGGKRVRPQLCLWTFQHSGGPDSLSIPALQIACGWELSTPFSWSTTTSSTKPKPGGTA
jgi:geranylgeranyl pyrophosphate synthase